MSDHKQVALRLEELPDDAILIVRAGQNSIEPAKLRSDADRSHRVIGILGVSVQASLPGESREQAWDGSKVLRSRDVIWWSTAGRLRQAGFPLLATGADERHYTIALAHTGVELMELLSVQFMREER